MRTKYLLPRAALFLSCLLPLPATVSEARAAVIKLVRPVGGQKTFRPYGYFSLVGKVPRGFENFDTIQYWHKADEQTGPDISNRMSGVNETGGRVYRYAAVSVTRQKFVFTTAAVKGVSYKFTGRFLRSDFVGSEMNFEKPVLVGTLGKYINGKRVAEAFVKLSYFAGT